MEKRVFVIGVFDLMHRGHLELLRRAKELGTILVVGINSDIKVASYKRKPYLNENERLEVVEALKFVDIAFIMNDTLQRENISKYNIDVIVHGDDWPEELYLKHIGLDREYLEKNNIELKMLPHTEGISTSDIIKRIKSELEIELKNKYVLL